MSIQAVSGMTAGMAPAVGAKEAPAVRRPGEEARPRPPAPARDEYVPEKKEEPSGRYWLGRDEDGRPKVYFDDPERAADAPAAEGAKGPEKQGGGRAEQCRGSTDAVDREIERLKKKRQELEQRLGTETDETKIKQMEQKLAQVERELAQKDNDAYRRQHMVFS